MVIYYICNRVLNSTLKYNQRKEIIAMNVIIKSESLEMYVITINIPEYEWYVQIGRTINGL